MTSATAIGLAGANTLAEAHAAQTEHGDDLLAGVASRDVTPDPGVPMWGYSNRKEPAKGALDKLFAKAVVFRGSGQTVALVVIDFGRVPIDSVCDRIRTTLKPKGIDHIIFEATHTHGGPIMESDDAPHIKRIELGIVEAIVEAAGKLKSARVSVGTTTIDIAHNRRVIKGGECYMLWRNEKKIPTEPIDHEATLIKIEDSDGKSLAALVHYACHPVVLGADNVQYTGDWAGEMCRIVKEKSGAECLFLQGGAGDINPYLDKTPLDQGGLDSMRRVGSEAAGNVLAALAELHGDSNTTGSVDFSEKKVAIGTRWDFNDPSQQQIFRSVYGGLFDKYLAMLNKDLACPLAVLVLNKKVALAFMPGELFVQYQLDLKSHSPLAPALLCGYANGFHLYFPTLKGAAAGGYGGIVATYVGNGAGDRLLAEALIEIGNLSRKIKPKLDPADFELKEV
jgi:neutral ceramidase